MPNKMYFSQNCHRLQLPTRPRSLHARFLSVICGLLILAGQMLWLAIQKPVPPTNDNNAWSKIQVITNLWSNEWGESTFPFFWYDEFLRFSWPMKFSDMSDLMIFFFFLFALITTLISLMTMVKSLMECVCWMTFVLGI